jgi:hypothetical protein
MMLLAPPVFARFATTFAEAASAAPIIIRTRVQAKERGPDGVLYCKMKIIRTIVRAFAARHIAHTELYPGKTVSQPCGTTFRLGLEYLILLAETRYEFSVKNHCGTIAIEQVMLGTVPHFQCGDRFLWTLPEVEKRLTQPSVCPEQRWTTFSEPPNSFSGTPDILSLDEFDLRERHPLYGVGALGLVIALALVGARHRQHRRLTSTPLSITSATRN